MKQAIKLLLKRLLYLDAALASIAALVLINYGAQVVGVMRADAATGVELPIIMYHGILKDPLRAGKFVVSPGTLKADLEYLKENGYTTVVIGDLIDFVERGKALPDKPVMITFDDGYYNAYQYALPILEELDMKAVVSVVGEYTEKFSGENADANPNYAHLSWEDICALAASGRVEIQNHSYGLHGIAGGRRGSMRKAGESFEAYRRVFIEDVQKLQDALEEKCGIRPTCFTYPLGAITQESREYLMELKIKASLGCYEHVNTITNDPLCLYRMGRFNRPSGIGTEQFMKKVL